MRIADPVYINVRSSSQTEPENRITGHSGVLLTTDEVGHFQIPPSILQKVGDEFLLTAAENTLPQYGLPKLQAAIKAELTRLEQSH